MKLKRILLIHLGLILTAASYAMTPGVSNIHPSTKIQQIIHMMNKRIPAILATRAATGAEVAIVDSKGVIWGKAYGYLSTEHKKKVNLNTIFSMESDSKMFTATGVLIAAQKHLLNMDEPISSYLPSNYKVRSRFSKGNPIRGMTLENLLSHTAGLAHEAPVGNNFVTFSPSFNSHIASIEKTWLRYPVRQRFAYSNLGIDLAGYIIQRQSHMPFVSYMTEYLLKPLGMNHSTFDMAKIRKIDNRAIGTIPGVKSVPLEVPMLAAGGLYSNVGDIAKYIIFQLNNGRVGKKTVLKQNYIKLMREVPNPRIGQKYGYALGIAKVKFGDVIDYNHNGGGFGFNSTINWCPKYNIGFVMLFNGRVDEKMNQLTIDIFRKLEGKKFFHYNTIPLKSYPIIKASKQYLVSWVGNYIGGFGEQIKIIYRNGYLSLLKDNKTNMLVYLGKHEFYSPDLQQVFRFINATKHQSKYIFQVSDGSSWDYNDGPNDMEGPHKNGWKNLLGEYLVRNTANAKIPIKIHIRNGWLYLDNYKLREFRQGLFVNCLGFVLDLRPGELSWNNVQILAAHHARKLLAKFTQYVRHVQYLRKMPGVAIAIIKNNKIIYANGFGVRNTLGDPITPDTIFNIASLTKSFTAALLASQIDEGKYAWNTKILKLYPGFKLYDPIATKKFEVRDLIAHDSGLPEDAGTITDFGYSNDKIIHALRFIKPVAAFRSQFAYQDIFLVLAQKIIEKSSGASYTNYLHKKLFLPLGMKNSYTAAEDINKLPNVSERYFYYRGKMQLFPKTNPFVHEKWGRSIELASGGIYSSANNLAKWLMFQMNNGNVNGRQIISKKNMRFLHTPQTKIQKRDAEGSGADAYCEGWFYNSHKYKPYTLLFHDGNNSGASAFMGYIPKAKVGIVILANNFDPALTKALASRFFNMYFKRPHKYWSTIKAISDDQSTKEDKCKRITAKNISRYEGTYYNGAYGRVYIKKIGRHLMLSIGPRNIKWELIPCRQNAFKAFWESGIKDLNMLPNSLSMVKFTENLDGVVSKMRVDYLNTDGTGVFKRFE